MIEYVSKKWGVEKWLCNNDLYCGKDMLLFKDHHCSAHTHPKTEDFWCYSGKILLLQSYNPDAFQKCEGISTWSFNDDRYLSRSADRKYIIRLHNVDLRCGDITVKILNPNDTVHIPENIYHMFYGIEESRFIEISTPDKGINERLTESW